VRKFIKKEQKPKTAVIQKWAITAHFFVATRRGVWLGQAQRQNASAFMGKPCGHSNKFIQLKTVALCFALSHHFVLKQLAACFCFCY
jgi:hypothetical protein